jgi:DNA-binding CsgD family transcriptional regulator
MKEISRPVQITSAAIMAIGVILLTVSIISGGKINMALPLLFLVLGGAFFILVFSLRQKWRWTLFLYIPALVFTAFGFIFLLNVLTQDWNAWAYAWLLPIAAAGAGLLMANREQAWHPSLNPVGLGVTAGGATLFVVFGAIVGGLFIQIFAPILVVAAGLSLRWVRWEAILPQRMLNKLHPAPAIPAVDAPPQPAGKLAEELSSRELEVLRLIDAGLSNQQIAENLSVAQSTVKTHINNIYGKLGVETRVQAINRARELGILQN